MSELDLSALLAVADAATPGPWFYNGYSAVFSEPMGEKYEAFWTEERENDGHTYDHRVGEICPACGERPAVYSNTAKPEVRGQRFGTYWDCAFHKDAYDVDPVVASTPSRMGDTATGRHAADAEFIATFNPATVRYLIVRLQDATVIVEGYAERLESKQVRLAEAWAERDALRARLAEVEAERDEAIDNWKEAEQDVGDYLHKFNTVSLERDALRASIRELADEWERPSALRAALAPTVASARWDDAQALRSLLDDGKDPCGDHPAPCNHDPAHRRSDQ